MVRILRFYLLILFGNMNRNSLEAYLKKITTKQITQKSNEKVASELREKLADAVKRNSADALLLSGGLDSSILAYLNSKVKAITVGLENAEDFIFAESIAKELKLKLYKHVINVEEAIEALPEVIRVEKTFNPALPNDVIIYFGLKYAKGLGAKSVMTGDGADELFAGYDYMLKFSPPDLDKYIRKLSQKMYFSSNTLGDFFGLKIEQPYLDKEFKEFAVEIPPEQKVTSHFDRKFGKQILREAFKNDLSFGNVWRKKLPIELGSGLTKPLEEYISSKVSDEEFRGANPTYRIHFVNKQHLFYYKIYRKEVGKIPLAKKGEMICEWCGAGIPQQFYHCRTCGYTLPPEEILK
ncbi:MAG: asparagine synthase-related protein [Candidatus Aenigmarchaeota archaeon]|nr:asparagine synthase-related protein [Candidatus Aenigmarchaeota archaeon]